MVPSQVQSALKLYSQCEWQYSSKNDFLYTYSLGFKHVVRSKLRVTVLRADEIEDIP